jgi:hypothetical protein
VGHHQDAADGEAQLDAVDEVFPVSSSPENHMAGPAPVRLAGAQSVKTVGSDRGMSGGDIAIGYYTEAPCLVGSPSAFAEPSGRMVVGGHTV